MKRIILAVLVSLVATLGTASAGTKTHRQTSVQFWIPDGWKVEESPEMLSATDPKEQVALLFMVRDGKDTKAALAGIDEFIAKFATDVKSQAPEKVTINGMEGVAIDGTGKAEGKAIELSIVLLKTPSGKVLTIFGMIEASAKAAHEANLVKIIQSLKPNKK